MTSKEFDKQLKLAEYHAEVVPVRYALTPEELHRVARIIFGKNWKKHPRIVEQTNYIKAVLR